MKIAISADLHLRSDDLGQERYEALRCILDRLVETDIKKLIIAGDLFDKEINHFTKFEKLVGDKKYSGISIYAIRGNHDITLTAKSFTLSNLTIIEEPCWLNRDEFGMDFLLLPYIRYKKTSELIEEFFKNKKSGNWVLVSHGDWIPGKRDINPYEQGVYMSLFSIDIQRYRPSRVFIGHIHKPLDSSTVIIPGSPCGLDITENGKRSFIIFDTNTMECAREKISSNTIFLNEQLTIIPSKDEYSYIKREINNILDKWGITEAEKKYIYLRLRVSGYSSNPRKLKSEIESLLEGIKIYQDEGIDFSTLKQSSDVEREFLINKLEDLLIVEIGKNNIDQSLKEAIEEQALDIIYGE